MVRLWIASRSCKFSALIRSVPSVSPSCAFESGVEAGPDNPVALANLGTHLLSIDDSAGAINYLRRAVAGDSGYLDAIVNLALAYFREEQYEDARKQAENALIIQPGNELAAQILGAI